MISFARRRSLGLLCSALVLLVFCNVLCWSATQANIHQEIQETYSFQPHQLTTEQRSQVSAVLDAFWSKAAARPEQYLPALRRELADFANPPFFLFDGSMLLLKLSTAPDDRKIALAAMAHCDLQDVQEEEYFKWVHQLATQGENTTAAAFRVLEDPKFKVVVPEHSLTLGQNYALVYMLLPTDQQFWEQAAIDRLRTEKDPTAQRSLLLLLWYAQTDAADRAIRAFARDEGNPRDVRAYAKKFPVYTLSDTSNPLSVNEATLRRKRQEGMRTLSDEALIELDQLTNKLHSVRKP